MGNRRKIEIARRFAVKAHKNQLYGKKPYYTHLDEVAAIVKKYSTDDYQIAAAYLHDVLEDTKATRQDIRSSLGHIVAQIVVVLTDLPGENRLERKRKTYHRFAQIRKGRLKKALLIKLADRLANVRACVRDGNTNTSLLKMYRREHLAFQVAVYREDEYRAITDELDSILGRRSS